MSSRRPGGLPAHRRTGGEEGVVSRRAAVLVEPEHDTREVRVVRLRPTELVVGHGRTRARRGWAAAEILKLAATADVADEDVDLPVGSEADHAAVVVAALRLPGVGLEGA